MTASKAVPNKYKSLQEMFEKTLAHEQIVTSRSMTCQSWRSKEKDHASQIFLQWFVTEQIEEENNDRDIIAKLKLVGTNGHGILMIDGDLGTRLFVAPAGGAAPFPVAPDEEMKIRFCQHNQGSGLLTEKLHAQCPDLDIKLKKCAKKCKTCKQQPFAVVDKQLVMAADGDALYGQLLVLIDRENSRLRDIK